MIWQKIITGDLIRVAKIRDRYWHDDDNLNACLVNKPTILSSGKKRKKKKPSSSMDTGLNMCIHSTNNWTRLIFCLFVCLFVCVVVVCFCFLKLKVKLCSGVFFLWNVILAQCEKLWHSSPEPVKWLINALRCDIILSAAKCNKDIYFGYVQSSLLNYVLDWVFS